MSKIIELEMNERNDEWIRSLPGYKNEVALHEGLFQKAKPFTVIRKVYSFPGHRGRPGRLGGSLPKGSPGVGGAIGLPGSVEGMFLEAKRRGIYLSPTEPVVWLNPDPKADIQAKVISASGKVQYKYSVEHSVNSRDALHARLRDFHDRLKTLERNVDKDFATRDEAKAILLISKSGIRVGSNKEALGKVKAYGATTLEAKHCSVKGDKVSLLFPGKKAVINVAEFKDARLARHIEGIKEGPIFNTSYKKVLGYLKQASGKAFTPKDLRTYTGTGTALSVIAKLPKPKTFKEFKDAVKQVCTIVSKKLNNTPDMAKKAYISPEVWQGWNPTGAWKFEEEAMPQQVIIIRKQHSFPGHAGRPGKVGGSIAKGSGSEKTGMPIDEKGQWLSHAEIVPGMSKDKFLNHVEKGDWAIVGKTVAAAIQKHSKRDTEHNLNALHVMAEFVRKGKRIKEVRALLEDYQKVAHPLLYGAGA